MAIYNSLITKYAVSRDSGGTWGVFPRGPSDRNFDPGNEYIQKLDGTMYVPQYYNLQLNIPLMTKTWYEQLQALYVPTHQDIYLNYEAESENPFIKWVYAPAIWAKPPKPGRRVGNLYFDVTVEFELVEWYLPYVTVL